MDKALLEDERGRHDDICSVFPESEFLYAISNRNGAKKLDQACQVFTHEDSGWRTTEETYLELSEPFDITSGAYSKLGA